MEKHFCLVYQWFLSMFESGFVFREVSASKFCCKYEYEKKNKTTYSYVNVQTVSHDVVRKKQVKSCSPLHKPAPMPKRKDSVTEVASVSNALQFIGGNVLTGCSIIIILHNQSWCCAT